MVKFDLEEFSLMNNGCKMDGEQLYFINYYIISYKNQIGIDDRF